MRRREGAGWKRQALSGVVMADHHQLGQGLMWGCAWVIQHERSLTREGARERDRETGRGRASFSYDKESEPVEIGRPTIENLRAYDLSLGFT